MSQRLVWKTKCLLDVCKKSDCYLNGLAVKASDFDWNKQEIWQKVTRNKEWS